MAKEDNKTAAAQNAPAAPGSDALLVGDEALANVFKSIGDVKVIVLQAGDETKQLLLDITTGIKNAHEALKGYKEELVIYQADFVAYKDDLKQFIESIMDEVKAESAAGNIGQPHTTANSLTLNTGTVISTSSSTVIPDVHAGLVKVEIAYPADFKGTKYFKDGDIKPMAKETADSLVAKGIAKIVE